MRWFARAARAISLVCRTQIRCAGSKALVLVAAALLAILPSPAQGAERSQPAPAPDWSKLDAEGLEYFRRYLQLDTSNPPGDTTAAVAYLKGILDREGIATETYAAQSGKVSLVARLPGPAGVKPLLLMSHADVVPAVAALWRHPPFAADLAGGYVWGRGAIDNKAHGIMALMTLLALKRHNLALRRGVTMMVNPEEEVGGELGAAWMVANHWEAIDPAFAFNEGGHGTPRWLGSRGVIFRVAVAEKRVMWLRLIAHGKSGHGSQPNADNPNLILLSALYRLLASQPPIRLIPLVAQALGVVGERMPFPASFELMHLNLPLMMRLALRGPLSDYMTQAALRDTIAPTGLRSGVKVNVIPSTAEATLDCRLLPGTDAEAFLARMRALMADKRISIEFIQRPDQAPPSPTSGEAWQAMAEVVAQDFPGAIAVPFMTSGGTDSRFLRIKGVPAYGFVPMILDESEAGRVHGVDERLSVENLERGIRATYDLTRQLCAARPLAIARPRARPAPVPARGGRR